MTTQGNSAVAGALRRPGLAPVHRYRSRGAAPTPHWRRRARSRRPASVDARSLRRAVETCSCATRTSLACGRRRTGRWSRLHWRVGERGAWGALRRRICSRGSCRVDRCRARRARTGRRRPAHRALRARRAARVGQARSAGGDRPCGAAHRRRPLAGGARPRHAPSLPASYARRSAGRSHRARCRSHHLRCACAPPPTRRCAGLRRRADLVARRRGSRWNGPSFVGQTWRYARVTTRCPQRLRLRRCARHDARRARLGLAAASAAPARPVLSLAAAAPGGQVRPAPASGRGRPDRPAAHEGRVRPAGEPLPKVTVKSVLHLGRTMRLVWGVARGWTLANVAPRRRPGSAPAAQPLRSSS